MKPFFFLSMCLFLCQLYTNAQDFNRIYFNSTWRITSADNATYYRKSSFNASIPAYDGEVTDYYVQNDKVEMTGQYKNGNKSGTFNFYYPDGTLKMTASYDEKGTRTGAWKELYTNGIVKISLLYENHTEKILEMNDSLGNPMTKGNQFKYNLYYYDLPRQPAGAYLREDDLIEISGNLTDNLRDGKWKIRRNGELYATLTYKLGKMMKGNIIINGHQSPLNHSQAFPLIVDPMKFSMTESFALDPGAVIKNNYVTEHLYQRKYKSMKKIVIESPEQLKEYIDKNFDLRSKEATQMLSININVSNGRITGFLLQPDTFPGADEELTLILNAVDRLTFISEGQIEIDYQVEFEDKIGN